MTTSNPNDPNTNNGNFQSHGNIQNNGVSGPNGSNAPIGSNGYVVPNRPVGQNDVNGFPPGFMDEGLLTRMANEFFSGAFGVPGAGESLPSTDNFVNPNQTTLAAAGLPTSGVANGVPNGFSGVPNGVSTGIPAGVPNGFPTGVPTANIPSANFLSLNGAPQGSAGGLIPSGFGNFEKFNQPSEADFRQLPARIAAETGLPLPIGMPVTPPGAIPGTIPGGFNLGDFTQAPAFSFLEEIRPLMSAATDASNGASQYSSQPMQSANQPIHSVGTMPGSSSMSPMGTVSPMSSMPNTNQISSMPPTNQITSMPAGSPYPRGGFAAPVVPAYAMAPPQIPGTVAHSGQEKNEFFGFQDQIRAMTRIDVIPSLQPVDFSRAGGLGGFNTSLSQFDVDTIRRDFPILKERVNGHPLIWLDNAATTQKPQSVIDRLSYFYTHENSNVHRAAHELAARSTDAYEKARESVRRFLNAPNINEIVFVRGATEAINLVAQTWGRQNIQKDDEVVISWLEHHANIVPWQMICAEKGARLKVAPVDDSGQILLNEYERLLSPKTRFVSLTQVSNALGTVTPIKPMIDAAHRYGAKVLIDGAQAVSHMQVDMQAYDCDFYVFSGHKVFGPTGIGVLYGKTELLETMPPWQGGGNMIKDVTFEKTLYQNAPLRFEAGTGNIADAVGLGAAIEYLERIGMPNISRHEHELLVYGSEGLKKIPGLHLVGTALEKAGVLSFVLDGFRTEEVSEALNRQGIAVRGGHHCAQPILRRFGLESTVRPSLALYNTCDDIDALISAVWNLKQGRNPNPFN